MKNLNFICAMALLFFSVIQCVQAQEKTEVLLKIEGNKDLKIIGGSYLVVDNLGHLAELIDQYRHIRVFDLGNGNRLIWNSETDDVFLIHKRKVIARYKGRKPDRPKEKYYSWTSGN